MPTTPMTTEEKISYYKRLIKSFGKIYHPVKADVLLMDKYGDDPVFIKVFEEYCP